MVLAIELSHFDGYFHLFAALNLAYAGWEGFRTALDNRILKISKTVQPGIKVEIDNFKNKMIILRAEQNPLYERVEALNIQSTRKLRAIINQIDQRAIAEGLSKSIFLFTGLYCVAFLILAGYEQFSPSMAPIDNFLLCLHISALYNIVLFCKSCLEKYKHQTVTPLIPLFLVLIVLIIATLYCTECPVSNKYAEILSLPVSLGIAVIIAASPYILYIARVYYGKFRFWYKFKKVDFLTKYKLEHLNYIIEATYTDKPQSLWKRSFFFLCRYFLKVKKAQPAI